MKTDSLIFQTISLFSRLINPPSTTRNLVVEHCLLNLLRDNEDHLPDLCAEDPVQTVFLQHFKNQNVTHDKAIDSAMFCLLIKSEMFWDACELVCAQARLGQPPVGVRDDLNHEFSHKRTTYGVLH